MLKNVSGQFVGVQMVSSADGTAFTGAVTVYVTVDNGTQTIGSVSSGVCTHKGNGLHNYAPSQAETNGNSVQFTFVGTGAVPQTIQFETLPTTGVLAPAVSGRTIAVSATTGKVTAEAVELDSDVGAQITNIENAAGYTLAVLAGACADPQTASETYAITVFGSTFTVDMAGQTSTGTRTAPTLTKS